MHRKPASLLSKPVNALESEVNPQVILSECFDEYGNDKTNSLGTNHSQEISNDQIHIVDEDKILNIEQNQLILEKGIKFPDTRRPP
ncbi:hypothetical protein ACUWCL_29085, partial [Klebsiella pneumoniae]|uniref:hypothetical protein n=1 Tax=Klebsiella pneumoniae TaxID=573 RepID=UPI0040554897